jgi:hypothetical protein
MDADVAETKRAVQLAFVEAVSEEVDAGADLMLAIRVTSAFEWDFSDTSFAVVSADGVRFAGKLPAFGGEGADVVRLPVTTPEQTGEFTWRLVIPEHERDGTVCESAELPFTFRTRPHVASLAAWDCPSPVVAGERFKLKIGAQCSACCAALAGSAIEIRDDTEAVVATVRLGDAPWVDTRGLYWTEVEIVAPRVIGLHPWTARLSSPRARLPHADASYSFSVFVDRPPEHTVTVQVVEEHTGAPIDQAQVRLGAYRLSTDIAGQALFAVPKGRHELFFWRTGYEAPSTTVDVHGDMSIRIEAKALPVANPDLYWQG